MSENDLLCTCTNELIFLRVEFDLKDNRSRTFFISDKWLWIEIINCDLMIVTHWRCSDVFSWRWDGNTGNWVFEFVLEDSFGFCGVSIPDYNGRFFSHLTCSNEIFFSIDIKTGDIIIVFSIDFLCIFEFIEDDSTTCIVVNNLTVDVVFKIGSCIVTSVTINITDL